MLVVGFFLICALSARNVPLGAKIMTKQSDKRSVSSILHLVCRVRDYFLYTLSILNCIMSWSLLLFWNVKSFFCEEIILGGLGIALFL